MGPQFEKTTPTVIRWLVARLWNDVFHCSALRRRDVMT